jgi:hypothetical protein
VYYARYPDATAGEIEAWLRDRGFDVGLSDVEDCMAALDSRPDWRTGWINRNIHRYAEAFDPDQFLVTRSYRTGERLQVVEDGAEGELEEEWEEEYEDDELEEGDQEDEESEDEYEDVEFQEAQPMMGEEIAPASLVTTLGGEDRLPGIVLAAVGLAVSAAVAALVVLALR